MQISIEWLLTISLLLFFIGVAGVMLRRNALVIFMSIEIMLNAANLAFVAFARHYHRVDGQVFVLFVMALAAAEVAVGLAIIVLVYRRRQTILVDRMNSLRG